MDSDSWIRLSSNASRRLHYLSDMYNAGGEECFEGGEDELRPEFLCPFCAENFDIVGLCCHIDEEHAIESKNGVCPVCARRVGIDLIDHVTMQHGNLLKVQHKRRFRRGGSSFAILRKELRGGNFQSLLNGSSSFTSSTSQADPLLSSFMFNPPAVDEIPDNSSSPAMKSCKEDGSAHRKIELPPLAEKDQEEKNRRCKPLSEKDQEEKTRRCEFVQGLLLSTFLDDDL